MLSNEGKQENNSLVGNGEVVKRQSQCVQRGKAYIKTNRGLYSVI